MPYSVPDDAMGNAVKQRLTKLLRRSPTLSKLINLLRFLMEEAWFAGCVWIAPKRFMDEAHLRQNWDFKSPYSQEWHRRVMAVVAARMGNQQWGDALEIGCSEGVFTSYLASRCRSVTAYDISPVALKRATQFCASYPNVRIGLLDLANEEIQGQYELVFAMDVLSCMRGRKRFVNAANKLANAIRDGGFLIYTDNSMPMNILRTWGSRRWWSFLLAMMEPGECVRFFEHRLGLKVLSQEQYVPDLEHGRDQMIALLQKNSQEITQIESVDLTIAP